MKDKQTIVLLGTWEESPSSTLRRLFWYHQARLRWTGECGAGCAVGDELCAGQIGVHEPAFRPRCLALGERLGLYKHDPVSRNCTPSYLPEFIRIEVAKRRE